MPKFKIALLLLILGACASYDPARYADYVTTAKAYYQLGNFTESLNYLAIIEKNTPLNDDLIGLKADNYSHLNGDDKAIELLNEAIKRRPHSAYLNYKLGQSYFAIGDFKTSALMLEKSLQKSPHAHSAKKALAKTYIAMDEYEKAYDIVAPEAIPAQKDEEIFYLAGYALYKLGRFNDSIKYFSRSFANDFNKKKSAQYLSFIHTQLKDRDKANYYIRHLIMEDPQDSFARKMQVKNLISTPGVDRTSVLYVFNNYFKDDWAQYEFYRVLADSKMDTEATEYLGFLWRENPSKLWVAFNYSKSLAKLDEVGFAKEVLEKTMAETKGETNESVKKYLASIENVYGNKKPTELEPEGTITVDAVGADKTADSKSRGIASELEYSEYTLQSGDNLETISQKFYGTSKKWPNIQKFNPQLMNNPLKMPTGTVIKVPVNP